MKALSVKKVLLAWPLLVTLVLALLYLKSSTFAITVNGLCEMLVSGGSRGLMMYYHDAGSDAGLTAIGASFITITIPAIKPQYLWMANTEYYGGLQGTLLTVVGALLALAFLFGWGKMFSKGLRQLNNIAFKASLNLNFKPLELNKVKNMKGVQMFWVVMSLGVASYYWTGWMALALGLWNPLSLKNKNS